MPEKRQEVDHLLFEGPKGPKGPKPPATDENGKFDRQTMRGLRELTPASAALLDKYVAWPRKPPKM